MVYKIRIILDTKEDVIRDIAISNAATLEELHNTIVNAFGFDGSEMASFYLTDNEWLQGEEIPLFDMSDTNDAVVMQNFYLKDILKQENDKLIYVYDFLLLWSFFVELITISDIATQDLPKLLISVGTVPNEAPEKKFVSEKTEDDFTDDFESLDDFDFDNFDGYAN